jgi:hypothetical protein
VTEPAGVGKLPREGGPPTPAAVALALLDAVVAYYAEHADPDNLTAPVPLPEKRFIAGGVPREVAWDTEAGQVHVAYDRTVTGHRPQAPPDPARVPRTPGRNPARLVRTVALEVQVVRPAPGLGELRRLPTTDELNRHGYAMGLDLHHLSRAVVEAVRDGAVSRVIAREAEVVVGDCMSLGPSGKVAGVAQAVTIPLL